MIRGVRAKASIWGLSLSLLAILVVTGCGGGGGGTTVTPPNNNNPVPSISSLSPSSVTAGAAAQTLTIHGSSFLSGSTVKYNGVAHTPTFVSSSQLTISLSTGDQGTVGSYAVIVTNPTPGGGLSNTIDFAVNRSAPTISSLSPNSAIVGASAQTLTIIGTNFVSGSTVTYNGVAHTATFVNATQLTISLSVGDQATAGTYSVVVSNPAPGGGSSSPANFAVNNPTPSITSLSPVSVTAGAGAQTLTINGANFLNTSTVTYNGVSHAVTLVNPAKVTVTLTIADLHTAGNYAVIVTNPTPGGGASNSVNFTVNSAGSITVTLNGSSSGSGSVKVGVTLPITAVVTGAPANLTFTVNGVANGNSTVGTITGSSSPYSFLAPAAIPGNDNPVVIVATQGVTGQTASLTVTITQTGTAPTPITITGGEATGINFNLTSLTTTLGLADVGTCNFPTPNLCTASVTGIQISRSGASTNFCGGSTCTVWLLGKGLTNSNGSALASGVTVSVTHPRGTVDVSVGTLQANALVSGETDIFVPIAVLPHPLRWAIAIWW